MITTNSQIFTQKVHHNNYLVRDHLVQGMHTLPGAALLDMVYRLFTSLEVTRSFELRNIIFKKPIYTTEEFDRLVYIEFTQKNEQYRVKITSCKTNENIIEDQHDENMECVVVLKNIVEKKHIMDVGRFINDTSTLKWNVEDIYSFIKRINVEHLEFMKTSGEVYQNNNEEIMSLRLGEFAAKYNDKFFAHPALLDSIMFAGTSFKLNEIEKEEMNQPSFLPFSIKRLCINKKLPESVYTFCSNKGLGNEQRDDLLTNNILILDETGKILVEVEELTLMRMRKHELLECGNANNENDTEGTKLDSEQNYKDIENIQGISNRANVEMINNYLKEEIGIALNKNPREISIHLGFYNLGLDSTHLLTIVKKLEKNLEVQLYPTLLFEYSTINSLSEYIKQHYEKEMDVFLNGKNMILNAEVDNKHIETSENELNLSTIYFQPVLQKQKVNSRIKKIWDKHLIILDQTSDLLEYAIKKRFPNSTLFKLFSDTGELPDQLEVKLTQVLEVLQKELMSKEKSDVLIQLIFDRDHANHYVHALRGILTTAYEENIRINSQMIYFDRLNTATRERAVQLVQDEALSHEKGVAEIYYQENNSVRFIKVYQEVFFDKSILSPYCKENGVYIITGGLGGLGYEIAKHITQMANIKVILIGRSEENSSIQRQINGISNDNASKVVYIKADVSNESEMNKVILSIKAKYGGITGIFHCAGIIKDQIIIKKKSEDIHEVLKPKVLGTYILDKVTKDERLDFFVLFSSISSVFGNLGQSDYAVANGFLDYFSQYRQLKVDDGERFGNTISINWPLWSDGGMKLTHELERMMYETKGMIPLPITKGLETLDLLINSDKPQVAVLFGDEKRIRSYMDSSSGSYQLNTAGISCEQTVDYDKDMKLSGEDIAIIGLSGRYPMADNVDQFYHNLKEGKNCITGLPEKRWEGYEFTYEIEQFYKHGGFLSQIDKFDPLFFSISPRQAELLDPQARLFLEIAWEACEDAGFPIDRNRKINNKDNSVGVFAGVFWNHYELYGAEMTQNGFPTSFGVSSAAVANMVSYCLNFNGPSLAVDTMCSSALTAIHLACESIRNGECKYAISGGVNLITHPQRYLFLSKAQFLSSDGLCKSFGEGGDGYVPGEGVGAVLLTSLKEAEKEGYHIYGVIRGSAINHGGKTSGITVPDPVAQSGVISSAIEKANVDPTSINYIEAHGTGTSLGDPIEIHGLSRAFSKWTNDKQFCAIGSCKSSIGHLEAAAGIAGLTKVLLQLKHGEIFPSLHAKNLNPLISFHDTPFYLERNYKKWDRVLIEEKNGKQIAIPRRAGISSFGANGSNAHLIVEEYVPRSKEIERIEPVNPIQVMVPLSAKANETLIVYAHELKNFLSQKLAASNEGISSEIELADIAYTLQIGREAMEKRVAFVVGSVEELVKGLTGFINSNETFSRCFRGEIDNPTDSSINLNVNLEDFSFSDNKLVELAKLWINGSVIDWDKLYRNNKPKRIKLPTYPFNRQSYWPIRTISRKINHDLRVLDKKCSNPLVKPTAIALTDLRNIHHNEVEPKSLPFIPTAEEKASHDLNKKANHNHNLKNNIEQDIPLDNLIDDLSKTLAEVLYMNPNDVNIHSRFIDMGLDSVVGLEWMRAINAKYSLSLPATIIYDYPTIFELSKIIRTNIVESGINGMPVNDIPEIAEIESSEAVETKSYINTLHEITSLELYEDLATSLSKALYMQRKDINIDTKFIDMGLDSIVGLEWIRSLNLKYSLSLNVTIIYDYPTIRELSQYLITEIHSAKSLGQIDKMTNRDGLTLNGFGEQNQKEEPTTTSEMRDPVEVNEPIAIIGMSGRYPDANDLEMYWNNLANGKNSIQEIPQTRWDVNEYTDSPKGNIYCKWMGYLEGAEYFDPLFFNIAPSEAELMDPQHRLFLQESYRAFEDAGYSPKELNGKNCGVYLGIMSNEYGTMLYQNQSSINNVVGNSYAIAAARISYFLNLKGPAIPVDTACSSALVATHLACQALANREIEMALVGGVSLYLAPESYISMCSAGMLSVEGQCKSFDNNADGFVPGEGVGALVLKRLKDAEADHDHIYGIIVGSGINQDGKTNGIMAPSANSQMKLLSEVYEKYNIDVESINYVEMHGTGTKLGDPIELEALSSVFKKKTKHHHFCGIGSVKSNIGHTSAAAGVASIQKVLLCMQHEKLVPTLNFKEPNEHFNFEDSPLYVNTELKAWRKAGEKKRRASISSFGFSGTNAHLVIEEYTSDPKKPLSKNTYDNKTSLFVLSAKTPELLRLCADKLLRYMEYKQDIDLVNVAYTLQVGREAMEFRLAIEAASRIELINTLKEIADNHTPSGVFFNQTKIKKLENVTVDSDGSIAFPLDEWITNRELSRIGEIWVNGIDVEWDKLYQGNKPMKISLPTYPFIQDRYWATYEAAKARDDLSLDMTALHPLIHQNTSNFYEQRYSSTFTGNESFLKLTCISGQYLFPGGAFLEMARVAAEYSMGVIKDNSQNIKFNNVSWNHSAVPLGNGPIMLHVGLSIQKNDEIAYEIYSDLEHQDENIIYSYGSIETSKKKDDQYIDLESSIRNQQNQEIFSRSEIYTKLLNSGWECDDENQIETAIIRGSQLLIKLSNKETGSSYLFDLYLKDRLLQVFSLLFGLKELNPMDTITLKELEVFEIPSTAAWAVINPSSAVHNNQKTSIDIDFCDENGKIYCSVKGLSTFSQNKLIEVSLNDNKALAINNAKKAQEAEPLFLFEEVWVEEEKKLSEINCKTIVCFLSNNENRKLFLEKMGSIDVNIKVIFISQGTQYERLSETEYEILRTDRNSFIKVFEDIKEKINNIDYMLYLWQLEDSNLSQDHSCIFYILQAVTMTRLKAKKFMVGAEIKNQIDRCYLESWIGFERSLKNIIPDTKMGIILYDNSENVYKWTMDDWLNDLRDELHIEMVKNVLYKSGKRYVQAINPLIIKDKLKDIGLRKNGNYLITGGLGGIGILFAKHLAKNYAANLILTGRSPIDKEKQLHIKELEQLGGSVFYARSDISDENKMREQISKAKEVFGDIHGIIHAAGILHAENFREKELKDFQEVLNPKINGTMILDEILKEEPLDFICYFSSTSAILGDFGFCDYAIGNRFQMAYANYRNEMNISGKKKIKTFVINWPLWKDGGMGFGDERNGELYLKASGQRSLEAQEGIDAFEIILSQQNVQTLILAGNERKINRMLGINAIGAPTHAMSFRKTNKESIGNRRPEMKGLSLEQCVEWDLKELAGKILKLSKEKLDIDSNLSEFGFDSINLAEFSKQLTDHYQIDVTPAVFFGYSTLEKLRQYFILEYRGVMEAFYREGVNVVEEKGQQEPIVLFEPRKKRTMNSRFMKNRDESNIPEPIAIIGMSGRFPQARNIEEMWAILEAGLDVVKEIPGDRFNWRDYYGDSEKDTGKTNCKWMGSIPGISEFDPLFFEISPREAETMDPRQRLLLQESWNALEDAGYGKKQIANNRIGMYVGVEEGDYQLLVNGEGGATSNHNAILAARLSYFLNLSGPNMAINTACSSGLVAAHQACQSLRNGECDTAIAAGVNLISSPELFIGLSQAGMLSKDGKCYTFDERANGMVPGEAVAVVVLKRLSKAEADGDRIYAVIQGSGVNYDGKTNGITAPNGVSQSNLIKGIYEQYQVNPEEIEYIVTHGTGTKLGDPVEINALNEAFRGCTEKQRYCALTSTKTNFGHTLAASGLVSLISLVQALRYEIIPASLHCEKENSYISWKDSPFYVNKANKPWQEEREKRRVGAINSFGMSGTNAHMVIKSYPSHETEVEEETFPSYLIALSAKTEQGLQEKINELREMMTRKEITTKDLAGISYTLLEGRRHFQYRFAAIVQDVETTITALNQGSNKEKGPYLFEGKVDRTFKGQRTTQALAQELLTRSRSEVGDSQKYRETLYALAEFYCMGYEMDWSMMFANPRSNQINLPTYPFSKEKYWVERKEKGRVDAPLHQGQSTVIHPLLHRNTSDLLEQRFSSTFTGKDPFIKDSFRNGQRILHDYVFLEMARAAVIHGAGGLLESNTGILLKHITWENPLLLTDDPEDVHVGLNFQGDGDIVFEIYSKRLDNNNGFFLTHSVGSAEITSPSVMPLKIEDLYKICNNATYSFEQLRTEYNGIDARFDQVIDEVHIGDEQLLVKISSWPTLSIGFDQFIFEPSWMDAIVGLLVMLKVESSHEFLSLKEFEVYNTLKFTSWVYIRRIKDIELGLTNKISIDFYDNEGNILVRMVELELAARLKEGGGYSYEKPPENDANNSKIIIAPPPGIGNRRPEMKGLSLEQCVEWDLKELAGKILKLSKEILDIDSNLSEFGFDSINLAEFSKLLTDHYQIDVTPAVFFGHSTLEKLRQYFILEHRGVMEAFYREGVNVVEEKGQQEPIVLFEPRKKRTMNSRFMKNRDESNIPEPIAIIGMSGRFPQARNIEEMWAILEAGLDVVKEIPGDRFNWRDYYGDSEKDTGKTNCKWMGSIPGISEFDPLFFEISPREAETMDPRQRLLLQESWNALEDAGYGKKQIANNRIGMYVGVEEGDYQLLVNGEGGVTSNHNAILAARLSYFLNLSGPNMAINTACSSGLVAAHQACQSLRNGECDTAIAAGVNLISSPESFIGLSQAGMLSKDGKCYTFDERANGMVPGEAVAVVVLKRLSKAEADGDRIYAVIQGSGVNYDGKTNGITAPNGVSQSNLIKDIYEQYQVNPEEIEYIVTHGTGTKLGDPVEINALNEAFRGCTEKQRYCALTSTKTNFGHTLAASGLVSLISLVQALRYEIIPASLHCEKENSYISWKDSPFYVNKANKPWQEEREQRRVGAINSFGMSGTNAHMVIKSYPSDETEVGEETFPSYLIALSAKTQQGLQEKINELREMMTRKEITTKDLAGISYTLLEGRRHFQYRFAAIVQDVETTITALNQGSNKEKGPYLFEGKVDRTFKGQRTTQVLAQELLTRSRSEVGDSQKYRETLYALAEFYCMGYEMDWSMMFANPRSNQINLPTYPFSKEKYWVERKEKGRGDAPLHQGQSTVIRPLLQPNSEVEFVYINKINKPSGIKLNELKSMDAQDVISKSAESNSSPVEFYTLINNDTPTPLYQKDDSTDLIAEEIITEEVIVTLGEVLQMNPSDMDSNKKFIEMGLDSILGVELVRSINKKYGTSIPVTKVYDYPTITEFSGYLMREVMKSKKDNSSIQFNNDTELTSSSTVLIDKKSKNTSISLSELQDDLLQSLAESLYLSQNEIDQEKRFIDMGLDSIIGVEWVRALNKKYGISIPVTKVYDYPTIRELSMYLEKELSKKNEKECVGNNPSLSIREALKQVQHKKMSIEEANQIIFSRLEEE